MKTAVLKVKCIHHELNPEAIAFESYISSPNTSIKIDFPNGKSLMEKGFRSIEMPLNKFYIEFFDDFDSKNMMDYLLDKNSDYRVTTFDGTIIRLCKKDYNDVIADMGDEINLDRLKEYEFTDKKKEGFFTKIKNMIHKKDN